eukprot:CAMPEP_0184655022 /NCGR_PEP_ID=MMETSP0308-20130426/12663_1 /TAXON_ID=38269 /ORGANISM="Gloeochaete witrockiana, Strain SAG 46.84" /LENGTH=325 /DNA_ID=CAMNT_0027091269 /DNA_START=1 /DNA_END=975 /DNA_ORIENTATION=-
MTEEISATAPGHREENEQEEEQVQEEEARSVNSEHRDASQSIEDEEASLARTRSATKKRGRPVGSGKKAKESASKRSKSLPSDGCVSDGNGPGATSPVNQFGQASLVLEAKVTCARILTRLNNDGFPSLTDREETFLLKHGELPEVVDLQERITEALEVASGQLHKLRELDDARRQMASPEPALTVVRVGSVPSKAKAVAEKAVRAGSAPACLLLKDSPASTKEAEAHSTGWLKVDHMELRMRNMEQEKKDLDIFIKGSEEARTQRLQFKGTGLDFAFEVDAGDARFILEEKKALLAEYARYLLLSEDEQAVVGPALEMRLKRYL